MSKPWYIDAWAVQDGRVFASRREPDSVENYVRTAETTIFMSVPDFQAVPVGGISTALRATRSGFQDKFRENRASPGLIATEEPPAEIPFDSLEQIRDLVRRAYLAAGLGPGAPGGTAGAVPAPDINGGPGGAFIEQRVQEFVGTEQLSAEIPEEPPADLDEALYLYAQASLLEWDPLLAGADPDRLRAFIGWCAALARTGVFTVGSFRAGWSLEPEALAHLASDHGAPNIERAAALIQRSFPPLTSIADVLWGRAYWTRGHLSTVPLARAPWWNPQLKRLVEMQLLPIVDRRFWSQPRSAIDLAPLVIVTLVRGPGRIGEIAGEPSIAEVGYRAARTYLEWVDLPDAAETALEHFIDACIAGNTTPTPTPTPDHAPRPNPSPPSSRLTNTVRRAEASGAAAQGLAYG